MQQATSLERRYPSSCCLYGGTVGWGCTSEATERFARPRRQCTGATYFLGAWTIEKRCSEHCASAARNSHWSYCLNSLLAGKYLKLR